MAYHIDLGLAEEHGCKIWRNAEYDQRTVLFSIPNVEKAGQWQ